MSFVFVIRIWLFILLNVGEEMKHILIKVQINQFKLREMGVEDAYVESFYVLSEIGYF